MRHILTTIAVVFVMTLTPFISGCGKKAPPERPPLRTEPVKLKEALPTAEVTAPGETTTGETPGEEAVKPDALPDATPDGNGAGSEEEETDIFPPEMTPKELLRMDEAPEDWI